MQILDYKEEYVRESKGIIIYGAGKWGKIVCKTLENWNVTPTYFVDRHKVGKYCGVDIITCDDLNQYLDYDVLICAPSAFDEVKDILKKKGFHCAYQVTSLLKQAMIEQRTDIKDSYSREELVEVYTYYMNRYSNNEESIIIPQMSFSITEACTLKCKSCNALMPKYKMPKTQKFEEYLKAMNRFLETVEKLVEIGFIGGEPFLNKELYKYIEWAVKSSKIDKILLVTNSTIMPDEVTIQSLKNPKVYLCLDDYGELSKKLTDLKEMAVRENINHYVLKNDYWYDLGGVKNNYSFEKRKKVFLNCPMRDCHFFKKGKLYRCQYEGSLMELGICENNTNDYVDFNDDDLTIQDFQKQVHNLITRKEPLLACDFCNDIEEVETIPVALQV